MGRPAGRSVFVAKEKNSKTLFGNFYLMQNGVKVYNFSGNKSHILHY